MDDVITLKRAYLPDGNATLGRLELPGGETFYTLERPWKGNRTNVSCIPEGVYDVDMRASGVVSRTSGGEYNRGWEVTDVPERTYIMFHPGNYAHNTEGCILPGRGFSWHNKHGPMVTHSRDTFRRLIEALGVRDRWSIDVRVATVEYP